MKISHYLLLLVLFIPVLLLRDFTPDNELRYLSIADEALCEGNFFAFTNHAIPYADKPPLYLWIVMFGKWILGTHSMLFLGLFSVLPAFGILYIMERWTRKQIATPWRTTAQLTLMSCAFFIGSALVLRMDMLMCLFIVLALHTFYRIYSGDGTSKSRYLLALYIFLALFTKGPVGILVPVLSITMFLAVKGQLRNFGRYFSLGSGALLLGCAAGWFLCVYLEGGPDYLHNLLFNQTINRAVDSFHHKAPVYYYLQTIWYAMAPWSLLFAAALIVGIRRHYFDTPLIAFFSTVAATTFVMLSLISSKIDIYLLPVYPFICYICVLILSRIPYNKWIATTVALPAATFALLLPILWVAPHFVEITAWLCTPIYLAGTLVTLSGILALYFLYLRRNLPYALNTLAIGLFVGLFAASFALPRLNTQLGYGEACRKALQIANQQKINRFASYKIKRAENMDVYLGHPLQSLNSPEDLSKLDTATSGSILFLRNRDLQRDSIVQKVAQDRKIYPFGSCSFVVF